MPDQNLKNVRPRREHRKPARYRQDTPPVGPVPILDEASNGVNPTGLIESDSTHFESITIYSSPTPTPFRTPVNKFNVFRNYLKRPTSHPDGDLEPDDFTVGRHVDPPINDFDTTRMPLETAIHPSANMSMFLLMQWFNKGGMKSQSSVMDLVHNVIRHDNFNPNDLAEFNIQGINKRLDDVATGVTPHPLYKGTGWSGTTVKIQVPFVKAKPKLFHIPGFHHRRITPLVPDVLRRSLSPASEPRYDPYRQFVLSPTPTNPQNIERTYDDLYTGDAWLDEQARLNNSPPARNADGSTCTLPRVIAGLMMYSDVTLLSQIGSQKLWPIVLMLGNQPKSLRSTPSNGGCVQLAYLPPVS